MQARTCIGSHGDVVCDLDGVLGVFDRRGFQPPAGVTLEVMVCASLRPRADGTIPGLVVRPVTQDDLLVSHRGFERSGPMARTTARLTAESDGFLRSETERVVRRLTPGRTDVVIASNADVGDDGRDPEIPTPAEAYVTRTDVLSGRDDVAGVPRLDLLSPRVLARLARRPGRIAA